jgi:hypothetical protein
MEMNREWKVKVMAFVGTGGGRKGDEWWQLLWL